MNLTRVVSQVNWTGVPNAPPPKKKKKKYKRVYTLCVGKVINNNMWVKKQMSLMSCLIIHSTFPALVMFATSHRYLMKYLIKAYWELIIVWCLVSIIALPDWVINNTALTCTHWHQACLDLYINSSIVLQHEHKYMSALSRSNVFSLNREVGGIPPTSLA